MNLRSKLRALGTHHGHALVVVGIWATTALGASPRDAQASPSTPEADAQVEDADRANLSRDEVLEEFAQDPDFSGEAVIPRSSNSLSPGTTAALRGGDDSAQRSAASSSLALPSGPMQVNALPTGSTPNDVTSKTISIPNGSGTIKGMEESFSAQLSTGIANFNVPLSLPAARGKAQPSLSLSYSSASGFDLAGVGWSIGVPFIARQTDRGVPGYRDMAKWHPEQDRFVFNGGQELIPICDVDSNLYCSKALVTADAVEQMPGWARGWQYHRARVEGSFLRFFWSPDHLTWRVQDKTGITLELGVPLDGSGDRNAIEANPDKATEIYKWHLARQYDTYGNANPEYGNPAPANLVVYKYVHQGGMAYLADIFDTPPATSNGTSIETFAHHTHLIWETRTDPTASYRAGWRVEQTLRLARVDVTSKTFNEGSMGPRRLVRRYHVGYDARWHASLLSSIQIEGRCTGTSGDETNAPAEDGSWMLAPVTNCALLPPMSFTYGHVGPFKTDGTPSQVDLAGYEGFDERIRTFQNSPNHSVDEQLTSLYDVNADALPDVVVTAPALFGGKHGLFLNSAARTGLTFNGTIIGRDDLDGIANVDANVLTFKNANIRSLDLDGDGQSDLIHMPRVKKYEVFTPVRRGNDWWWSGRVVSTADQQDAKIDFTNENSRIKVADVNFDGLVDVVFSSGTELQTFFALGRYPSGDGQFGWARRTAADAAQFHNDPVRMCLPWSASAIQFDSSDVRLADMNGDGIVDIVRVRPGDVRYWPGRGNGFWGTGARDDCGAGTYAQGRHVAMVSSPQYGVAEEDSLLVEDANGDGLDDIVEVRYNAVDIYLNVDGVSWTKRHVIFNSPVKPGFANRVRVVDVNGSGTRDILYGDGRAYKFIDLQGGAKPWLLTGIENGLGKTTAIEYSTSTEEMLEAERNGVKCNLDDQNPSAADALTAAGTDPWSKKWCTRMPTVAHVVKRVTESDNITVAGKAPGIYVSEYDYRDPWYEGRQREFRGFRFVRTRRVGDTNSPTEVTESTFLLGECRDETPDNGVDDCDASERWRDNSREALKGLPVVTEKRDDNGTYFSTEASTYRLRTLYTGLDGRAVQQTFAAASLKLLYDTSTFDAASGAVRALPLVEREGFAGSIDKDDTVVRLISRSTSGTAEVLITTTVDAFGNQREKVANGCVGGEACPVADEVITQSTVPGRPTGDPTGWLWRSVETSVHGNQHVDNSQPVLRNHYFTQYDGHGDPVRITAELSGALALQRAHNAGLAVAPPPSAASAQGTAVIFLSSQTYDAFGNPKQAQSANGRCSDMRWDEAYAQLPTSETVYTDAGCQHPLVTEGRAYDRGLALLTVAVDMQQQVTTIRYDEFGRLTELTRPSPGASAALPSTQVEYFLSSDLGPDVHHSIVHTSTQDGSTADEPSYLESFRYVDGFGRTLVTLSEADPTAADGGDFIAEGLSDYDNKAAPRRRYVPFFTNSDPLYFDFGAQPTASFASQRYDAYERRLETLDLDGTVTFQAVYHALETNLFDAADVYPGEHQGTPAGERKDGHGRSIVTTERFRTAGALEARHQITQYLPTGEPEVITRRREPIRSDSPDVIRWMRYDSLGRMVLNVEPNTSANFNGDHHADPAAIRAWRYAYDDAGDLVGTSDARGCGVNYLYDAAGRMLGEDYSPCASHQAPYTPPNLATMDGLEVVYQYGDRPQNQPVGVSAPAGYRRQFSAGRLAAIHDRAASRWTTYDARGRTIQTDIRVAQPKQASDYGTRYAPRVYTQRKMYDVADRQIAATTGARTAQLQGSPLATGPLVGETSAVTTEYSKRGTTRSVGGSYATLVSNIKRAPDGLHEKIVYGDLAATTTEFSYDGRRRLSSVQTYRGPPTIWSSTPISKPPTKTEPGPTTHQLLLQDEDLIYDVVDNPIEIRDWRNPDEWPAGAKPVSRRVRYDDLNRVKQVDYKYSPDDDIWVSPYKSEVDPPPNDSGDPRRGQPSPHVAFDKRILSQSYEYDWLGNTDTTGDDAFGFYDRSLGTIQNGPAVAGPYQLRSASNKSSTPHSRDGQLSAAYDAAGNLGDLAVNRNGPCNGDGGKCNQRFHYDWDEVGRLVRARRWDINLSQYGPATTPIPNTTPTADLEYRYDASDERVLKLSSDAGGNTGRPGTQAATLYIFDTLELRRTLWAKQSTSGSLYDYDINEWSEVAYLFANDERLARLAFERERQGSGRVSGEKLHVFFELGDHLGSSSVVIDGETSELVERTTYLAYGATESDYRPEAWHGFREDYKFSGKEEDVEVGLQYFGKRYLNPYLARWMSADPLELHGPGSADANLYAYVRGEPLKAIDPFGLEEKLPKRAVSVVLSGGTDNHLKWMDKFAVRNYGVPGTKLPKQGVDKVGAAELRRAVAATGRDAASIARDIGRAAKSLGADRATTKAVSVIVHGNSRGFGREEKGNWITAEKLIQVNNYRRDLFEAERALNRVKAEIAKDPVGWAPNEISNREDAIARYKEDNRAIGELSGALTTAARELKLAGVHVVELQGCNVGDDVTFKNRLGAFLTTADNKVTVGAFTRDVLSRPGGAEVGVADSSGRAMDPATTSKTTLPTPDRN